MKFRFEQRIDRTDDVSDGLRRCVIDTPIHAALRIILSKKGFIEVDNRIFEVDADIGIGRRALLLMVVLKGGVKHLIGNIPQQVDDVV